MMFDTENIITFARPMTKRIGMETITITYEPSSDFAIKLEELIRNSKDVRVVKRCLTDKQMAATRRVVESIKQCVKDVDEAAQQGKHVGRNADEFLCELLEEQSWRSVVYTHPEFERQFRKYKKKYHSLTDDFSQFLSGIKENPFQGVSLGNGVRKVRFGVSSKGRGKRGGMRVITYSLNKLDNDNIEVTLLYIYDKSEIGNISDQFLIYLLKE